MTVAQPVGDPAYEDLTARARIRDAALRLFAERGVDGTPIRDIAAEARVSPGLVRHHFGSKQALRNACDAYAMDQLDRIRREIFDQGGIADPTFLGAIHPLARLLQKYLVHSLMDGSDAATAMFDEMVKIGEDWLVEHEAQTRDLRAFAAIIVFMKLGVFVVQDQLSRVLGSDVGTTEGYVRMLRGFVDVTSQPLISREQAAQLHAALDRLASAPDGGAARATSDTGAERAAGDSGAERAAGDSGAERAATPTGGN